MGSRRLLSSKLKGVVPYEINPRFFLLEEFLLVLTKSVLAVDHALMM